MCKKADLSGYTTVFGGKRSLSCPLHRVTFLLLRLQWPETSKCRLEANAEMMQMCWQSSSGPRHRNRVALFQNMQHTTHKSRWIRATGQTYGDELRHSIHCTLRSPLIGVSSRLSRRMFNLQTQEKLLLKYLTTTTFRHHGWRYFFPKTSNVSETIGDYLEQHQFTQKSTSKAFNPSVRFG